MVQYLKTHVIMVVLLLLTFLSTCSNSSNVKSLKKEIVRLEHKNDSLNTVLVNQMQIEGLKSEKRMIQSTDRKILDVNRMSEIDKELKQYTGK
jgi:hypothetical protein